MRKEYRQDDFRIITVNRHKDAVFITKKYQTVKMAEDGWSVGEDSIQIPIEIWDQIMGS